MLAGLYQDAFVKQWGPPEIQIHWDQLGTCYQEDSLAAGTPPLEETLHAVWIYKERDRILFFTKKRLVSHFRWSDFKEKERVTAEVSDTKLRHVHPAFSAPPSALVA
jgi:hypothetical protein